MSLRPVSKVESNANAERVRADRKADQQLQKADASRKSEERQSVPHTDVSGVVFDSNA